MAIDVRLDGLTLAVSNVRRSMKLYSETLGFDLVVDAAPDFAQVRARREKRRHQFAQGERAAPANQRKRKK